MVKNNTFDYKMLNFFKYLAQQLQNSGLVIYFKDYKLEKRENNVSKKSEKRKNYISKRLEKRKSDDNIIESGDIMYRKISKYIEEYLNSNEEKI